MTGPGRRELLAAAALAVPLRAAAADAPTVAEPDGYRLDRYGSPTPSTLRGATVLSTAQVHAVWAEQRATLVDVLPQIPRPPGLPASTVWIERPHDDIPGSIWLPDTGYGALAPSMQAYFETGLRDATAGDRERALIFYCKPSCWMSWNAARRAVELGYRHVDWYPGGVPAWRDAGYPVERRQPKPRPPTID